MANNFPYIDLDEDVRTLMTTISTCRMPECPVVQNHPFYPTPEAPPFYAGKRPCLPVVPTHLRKGKVMIIGEYPNCRFATVQKEGAPQPEKFVPVADINEPFEGGQYYDGYSVRDYPTAVSLAENYLKPLHLSLDNDVWLTNMVKCFLLQQSQIESYAELGWLGPASPPVSATYDLYFTAAAVCAQHYLINELALCQPVLIIALGQKLAQMIHGSDTWQPASHVQWGKLTGLPLRAQQRVSPLDTRNQFFIGYNVIHLFHPSALARDQHGQYTTKHNHDLAAALAFLQELGLVA